jgi:hypothetical protein
VQPVQGPNEHNLKAATVGFCEHAIELRPCFGCRYLLGKGLNDCEVPGLGKAFEVGKLVVEALVLGGNAKVDGGFHMGKYEAGWAWSTTRGLLIRTWNRLITVTAQ